MSEGTRLEAAYCRRFAGTEEYRQSVWKILTKEYFQRWVRPGATVVDLGAGYCEFINNIDAGTKIALDLNPSVQERAAADVRVIVHDVTQSWPLASDSADVLFTSNFFEHLPDKTALEGCLAESHRVLKPGGLLIALGPNIRFCGDLYWDFFDHYIPLSDRSLIEALGQAGFAPVEVVPRFLPFTMVNRKPNLALVRVYLHLPFVWRFFGKQFLVVVRKAS